MIGIFVLETSRSFDSEWNGMEWNGMEDENPFVSLDGPLSQQCHRTNRRNRKNIMSEAEVTTNQQWWQVQGEARVCL